MENQNNKVSQNNIIKLPSQLAKMRVEVNFLKTQLNSLLKYLLVEDGLNSSLVKINKILANSKKFPFVLNYANKGNDLQLRGVIKSTDTLISLKVNNILELLGVQEQKDFLENLINELMDDYKFTQAQLHQSLIARKKKLGITDNNS